MRKFFIIILSIIITSAYVGAEEGAAGKLNELSKNARAFNIDSSESYAREALTKASLEGDNLNIARAMLNIAIADRYKGRFKNAIENANEALKLFQAIKDKYGEAHSYNVLGWIYFAFSDYDVAEEFHKKSIDISKKIHSNHLLKANYINLALIYLQQKDFAKSINYNFKSLDLSIKIGDSLGIAKAYNNIAILYIDVDQLDSAETYLYKALQISIRNNYSDEIDKNMLNSMVIFQQRNNTQQALKYYRKSLNLNFIAGNIYRIMQVNSLIGDYFYNNNIYDSALIYYQNSLTIADSLKNDNYLGLNYNRIAQVYREKKNLRKSLEYAEKAYNQKMNISSQIANLNLLRDLTKALKKYDKHFHYDDEYIRLALENNQNKHNQIVKLQIEKDQKAKEISLLKKDIIIKDKDLELQRNTLIFIIIIGILIIIISYQLYSKLRSERKVREELISMNRKLKLKNIELSHFYEFISIFTKNFLVTLSIAFQAIKKQVSKKSPALDDLINEFKAYSDRNKTLFIWAEYQNAKELQISEFNLNNLLKDVLQELSLTYSGNTIEFNIDELLKNEIILQADPELIRQIFNDLFISISDYSSSRTSIDILIINSDDDLIMKINTIGMKISDTDFYNIKNLDYEKLQAPFNMFSFYMLSITELFRKNNIKFAIELNSGIDFIITIPRTIILSHV